MSRSATNDKTRQPKGDPDCKLGVKSRRNLPPTPTTEGVPASATPTTVAAELYWGYASGVVATPLAQGMGDVVLAEVTKTFDHSDISYFHELMANTVRALGFTPKNGAWDAAFDAFYVHDYFHAAGGIAAVPLNLRGQKPPRFYNSGAPLCPVELPMAAKFTHLDEGGLLPQTKTRYVCPLLFPDATGESCDHPMFAKGGCTSNRGASPGATIRYTLDRESEEYKQLYRQRSSVERINAQATALGIERPKLRNFRSIRNRNTLIYILLNLQTYQRLKKRKPEWVDSP